LKLQAAAEVMMTLEGAIFQTYLYIISLLNKISFDILKAMVFFLNRRAAEALKTGAVVCV
jgi:hypothetical protein